LRVCIKHSKQPKVGRHLVKVRCTRK